MRQLYSFIAENRFTLKRSILPVILLFLFSTSVFSQTRYTISGTITDESEEPIIGAQVFLEGTTIGTVTDIEGKFTIETTLSEGAQTLVVRFVGYSTIKEVINLGSQTAITMDFSLEDDPLRLSEVVITGTSGLQEKKQLGNTISTVDGGNIQNAGTVDITAALSGKFAGVQVTQNSGDPAAGISVRLRSASTVNGSSDPLYIIDGVIVNNSSTDVLGVTSVVQNRLSDINPEDIDRIEVIKGGAAAAIYGSRASNGVVQIFTKRGTSGKPVVTFSSSVNFNSLRKKIDYNTADVAWNSFSDNNDLTTSPTTRYDYQDEVFQNSSGTDSYISVGGGANNTRYFASASYLSNEGIMRGSDFHRSSGRIRIEQIINDWASISGGTYVSSSMSNDLPNGGYGYGVIQTILFSRNNIDPKADVDGNYNTMTFYPNINEYIETFRFQQFNERSISDIQVNLTPLPGLSVNYILGYDASSSRGERYVPLGTTTATQGNAETSTINSRLMNSDLTAVFTKDLSSNIKSTTAAGYTYQYDNTDILRISASNLALGVETTSGAGTISTTDFRSERAIWGGFIQQTFGLQNKLFVTLAGRMDGSSVFGEDERNQLYPKASLSYLVSDESFFDGLSSVFSSLKVRGAWGQAGNLTAISPYTILTNYSAVSIGGAAGLISPTQVGNPGLRPERQTEIEIGADMALLNNKVGIEFTWYSQDIEDLLLNRTLSPSTGAGSRVENIGTMTNKGIEIQVSATVLNQKDLKWSLIGTFSRNRNEVNGVEGEEISIGNFNFSKARNGEPLGVFRQSYYATNPDGSLLLDLNGLPQRERGSIDADGNNISERDGGGQPTGAILQKIIGDPNPDYIASLISDFQYKNLSFRLQFDAVQGFDVLSWDSRMLYRFGGGEQTERELLGLDPKGTGAAKFGIAEAYVEDGSFTKLREMSIMYDLKNPIEAISNLKISLTGRNLFSIDNYSKWDPEVNMDAQSNGSRGGIMGLTPIPRVITLGFTATF